MQFVYLAHPFTQKPNDNVNQINKIAKIIINIQLKTYNKLEFIPFIPHNNLSIFVEEKNPAIRPITEEISQMMVKLCSQLWICSTDISSGMKLEIDIAKQNGIPVVEYKELVRIYKI